MNPEESMMEELQEEEDSHEEEEEENECPYCVGFGCNYCLMLE